ncbi:poly(beta-D-mannuronate) lyase [Roseivirga pacifica]|uniref:Poly(Beta-D-mannuronate) lyase n=1 Tax=Roseivirga pacifica TaxID=1267423 RepID=A0A1I0M9D5_9BACT|nr:polysaccharide lyase 6 family protein [Roseivirga pacifica]RKQ50207.1 poly(beta-D-mannuronate) lyase [Roseivirga pacifica]SEV85095.1 poly(beta-D-mannuronate) lyase [Roseivirga pacifica]
MIRLTMRLKQKAHALLFILSIVVLSCSQPFEGTLVQNLEEYEKATKDLKPGETIVLANGEWHNAELRLKAKGTKEKPITLKAETPGKVILTGQSNLAFSGEFIEISGLVFKNGYTPTSEVISFKTGKSELANNSRVTNCVIDSFSNPERFDGDTWVAIYGKNNRFDHNSLIGKGNRGVTLAVKLTTEESRENNHVIEKNYFGPRQVLGSNGGETLRVGTSHYSRTYSNTIVRNNYFDRVNGEHEIISNKACGNQFTGNVFFESQGTLTMRHGHHTLVEQNYFLGNRKANTGGIRIINEYQTVKNNYLSGLTGHRFRGALVIMNGVPNSPINRYNQVVDSHMENNIVVNSDYIQLCAGSDEERSAVPIGSSFKHNLIISKTNLNPFTIYDDVSGIEFEGNLMNEEAEPPFNNGFGKVPFALAKNENGLVAPDKELTDKINFGEVKLPINKNEVGASYYPKDGSVKAFNSGKVVKVAAGTNTILEALENVQPGDVLELENGGEYLLTKYAYINSPVSIVSPQGGDKAKILSEKQSFFKIENGGALQLTNVHIDGAESPDQAGNNVVSTSKYSMNKNYALVVGDCEITNLDKNHSFDFLKSFKHTFADSVVIRHSNFVNVTGAIMTMDMEVEDLGIYNVENVRIENTRFTDVQGAIANIYRGGTDESTFGPIVSVADVTVNNSSKGSRNKVNAAFRFHGVQNLNVEGVKFSQSAGIDLFMTNGEPISRFANIAFNKSDGLNANKGHYEKTNVVVNK